MVQPMPFEFSYSEGKKKQIIFDQDYHEHGTC